MINLLASFKNNKWRIILFPRARHRPSQFFESDKNKTLISPAAIDMSGLFILPREEDFQKLTTDTIIDIYKQVGITKEYFEYIKKKLSEIF